jgi:hypothetical protein
MFCSFFDPQNVCLIAMGLQDDGAASPTMKKAMLIGTTMFLL